jgi:D-glycero-D-manno-heptose 1,7-bisphosphate phosphatase
VKRRAVFLDLNGTLVMPIMYADPNDLIVIDDVATAVSRLSSARFVCPVVTIQSGIAKGRVSQQAFDAWFVRFAAALAEQGAPLLGPYVCPHRFAIPCPCKKPSPYLYEQAARDLEIDLLRSFVVGDSPIDVEAASRFGGLGCLVRTGNGESEKVVQQARQHAAYIATSLTDAVDWIIAR